MRLLLIFALSLAVTACASQREVPPTAPEPYETGTTAIPQPIDDDVPRTTVPLERDSTEQAPPPRFGTAQDAPASTEASMVAGAATRTSAEQAVAAQLEQDGVHVIHFWAPWCPNSVAELRNGWYETIEEHPEVSFTFVTIWNDGEAAPETLDKYAIPDRVTELTQADFGPSDDKEQRRKTFLDLPVTWIPTTWVFEGGELRYAFNYGELDMDQVEQAIEQTRADWSH